MAKMMMMADMWGSITSRRQMPPNITTKGKMPYRIVFIFSLKLHMSTEKNKMTAILVISEGWKVVKPRLIHRRALLAFSPMPGTSTSASSATDAIITMPEIRR